MQVEGFWPVFGLGCLGGALIELLRWWRMRDLLTLPQVRYWYWIITVLMIAAGGALAALYGLGPVNAIMVVNIGAAAPSIISTLAAAPPPGGGGGGGPSGGGGSGAMKTFGPPPEPTTKDYVMAVLSMDRRRALRSEVSV